MTEKEMIRELGILKIQVDMLSGLASEYRPVKLALEKHCKSLATKDHPMEYWFSRLVAEAEKGDNETN